MAIVHVVMKSSSSAPPSAVHADYISRDGQYRRRGGVELVESGNMPEFAEGEARLFWEAADQHERKNGRAYTELQIALPRELSQDERHELARTAAREFLGERFAYTLAVHNPVAKDSIEQPHFHLMFSERGIDGDTRALPGDRFFKRNGAKKDPAWNDRNKPLEVRNKWCDLVNDALAKAGHEERVDPRSWADQGRDDLAALVEPKLPPGSDQTLPKLHQEVDRLRAQRSELPCLYLPAAEATTQLHHEADHAITQVREEETKDLTLLERWISELKSKVRDLFRPPAIIENRPSIATVANTILPDHLRDLARGPHAATYLQTMPPTVQPDMLAYFSVNPGWRENPQAADIVRRHAGLVERNDRLVQAVKLAEKAREDYSEAHGFRAVFGASAYKRLEKDAVDLRAEFDAQRPELDASNRDMEPIREGYRRAMDEKANREERERTVRAEVEQHKAAYEQEMLRAQLPKAGPSRDGEAQERKPEPPEDALAMHLTQRQAELLVARQFHKDPPAQALAWADIQAGEPVVIAGRAWLEYSRQEHTYFAQVAPGDLQPFNDLLAQLGQRDQEKNQMQAPGWGNGREREV